MRILLTIIRVYWIIAMVWAISSWFGGISGPIGMALHWLMWPVWAPLAWLHLGPIWIGPMVMLLALWGLDAWLTKLHNNQVNGPRSYIRDMED